MKTKLLKTKQLKTKIKCATFFNLILDDDCVNSRMQSFFKENKTAEKKIQFSITINGITKEFKYEELKNILKFK